MTIYVREALGFCSKPHGKTDWQNPSFKMFKTRSSVLRFEDFFFIF